MHYPIVRNNPHLNDRDHLNWSCNLNCKDQITLLFELKFFYANSLYEVKVQVLVAQSRPTLCNPIDYTVHGILQARILAWVAIFYYRGSSWPRAETLVSHVAGRFFTICTTWEEKVEKIMKILFTPRKLVFAIKPETKQLQKTNVYSL